MVRIEIANNFFKKLIGLMGKKNINYGMFFPHVNSIHTYFMKEPIDIIGLDENMRVIEIYPSTPKNKIVLLKHSIHTLELPNKQSKTLKIGDLVSL